MAYHMATNTTAAGSSAIADSYKSQDTSSILKLIKVPPATNAVSENVVHLCLCLEESQNLSKKKYDSSSTN